MKQPQIKIKKEDIVSIIRVSEDGSLVIALIWFCPELLELKSNQMYLCEVFNNQVSDEERDYCFRKLEPLINFSKQTIVDYYK